MWPSSIRQTRFWTRRKQQYIWDLEHYTHLLEWRLGPKFREAFKAADREQLAASFRDDFKGAVLPLPKAPTAEASLVRLWKADPKSAQPRQVDKPGIVDWILQTRARLAQVSSVQFRILRIEQLKERKEWSLQILMAARGTDKDGSLVQFEATQVVRATWASDETIDGGAIFRNWEPENVKLTSSPRALLTEASVQTGLSKLPIVDNWKLVDRPAQKVRFQYAVEDFDLDGYLDIAIATLDRRLMLLRMVGGKFLDVTASVQLPRGIGTPGVNYSVGWIDYNNDGYPDLLAGGRFFRNLNGTRFADITKPSGLEFEYSPMGYTVADYNADGLLDLYITYSSSPVKKKDLKKRKRAGWIGDDASGGRNVLWKNTGRTGFVRAGPEVKAEGGKSHTFAAAWFFADGDHRPDLYVANDFGRNYFLRNKGDGTFEDLSTISGSADYATSMGVVAGDLDNDERSELYVANMFSKAGRRVVAQVSPADYPAGVFEQIYGACAGNRLYQATGDALSYREKAEPLGVNKVGWAYGPAMVDFDNDGLLDLYATAGFASFDRTKPDG